MADPTPSDLLQYLPDYKVIICKSCRYAIQPTAILRHLKDIHHILRTRRAPFADYIAQYELADADTIAQLNPQQVPELPTFQGLRCKQCSYLCVTEGRMRAHEHGLGSSEPVILQTFFRGSAVRYFVSTSLTGTTQDDEASLSAEDEILFQHYITNTSLTIDENTSLWQETIPGIAKTTPF